MHAAAYWGMDSMVQFLVDQGAEVNAQNKIGQTPLSIAVGVQRPGNEFYSWPNLQVLLKSLGGVVPLAEIEGRIAIITLVGDTRCPELRVALGEAKDYKDSVAGQTEFIFSGQYRHGIHQWQLRGPADWRACEGDGQPGDQPSRRRRVADRPICRVHGGSLGTCRDRQT